ncbi:hypothetical protein LCGC14_1382590, partial [marine sediment metagenome]
TTARYGIEGLIQTNEFTYIAVRYNESDVDIFIDDFWYRSAVGPIGEPWSGSVNITSGGDLIIGAELIKYTSFTGKLDDISVFNGSISDAEIISHSNGPVLEIDTEILKEDGQGGWTPLNTTGEVIDGRLTFKVISTGKPVDTLEFYLSTSEPDLQNPNPNDWVLFSSNIFTNTIDSWDIPDNSSWYFIAKATDDLNYTVHDSYSIYFGIDHFSDLINFTYLDKGGRINHNSQIGVEPVEGQKWHISSLNLYVNYSGDVDYLANFSYSDLSSYWLIFLDSLSDWITNKGFSQNEYAISFIVEANLTYGNEYSNYLYNFTIPEITLDIKGPDISLLSGGSYTLTLGSTYDDITQNLITMAINSSDNQLDLVLLEYKYDTPNTANWINYGSFSATNGLANIVLDLINLRDDNFSIRFTGYDNLSNSKLLYESNYWAIKDFNNHLQFTSEGLNNSYIYSLDSNDMVDLDLKILPVDNDIDKVIVSTNYETFTLQNVVSELDHIYFTDDGISDVDIKLNNTYYNVFGSTFTYIPVTISLYQGTTFITSDKTVISVITTTFQDIVNISGVSIDLTNDTNNILMSFVNNNNAYNNSHGIPFIVGNKPPVLKVYNSYDELVQNIYLYPLSNLTDSETYNTSTIEITDNRFIVSAPIPPSGELSSIDEILVNGTQYQFSYFIDLTDDQLYITLLTSNDVDGTYGTTNSPIVINYGISSEFRASNAFAGSYNFTLLFQDNYTFTAEFYTIEGQVSTYSILTPVTIDYQGPQIFKQFDNNIAINPESGSISFVLDDFSGIDNYYFNISVSSYSYWEIQGDLYTFYFNDTTAQDGEKYITFTSNDTLGLESTLDFILFFDKTAPVFSNIIYNKIYGNDLFEINFTISDSSDYTLAFQAHHLATNSYTSNFDFTVISVGSDNWQTLIASESLLNGYYNISITATDIAGNSKTVMIGEFYFDNLYPNVDDIQDQIYADNTNIYNTTLTDVLYFNDNKYIIVSANDLLYDNFNWSDYDQTIANQLGIKNITFFYTSPLAWYNLSIAGSLDYDTLTYRITGYGDPLMTDLSNIISIQKLKIGNFSIDKFTILLDGTSLLLQIDPQFRYSLSSFLTDQIFAQFYELNSTSNLVLQFNSGTSKWDLISDGYNYFDISEYLTLQEQDSFLFWLNIEDGFGNQLLSAKYKGIYDNTIQKNGGSSVFNWNVGTLSNGSGVIIFGSDNYEDSTIQINSTSILPTITNEIDVSRIYIYGSVDETEWNFTGRAYYFGAENLWNFYWDGDLLASQNNLPPVNYYLKTYIFDRAGNSLTFSININTFDYTQIELLTNLVFGSIFEFNSSSFENIQDIEGAVQNYFGDVNLLDIIAEYYSPIENQWVQLAIDPATIYSNGSYHITWDIDADPAFYLQMYEFTYEYLPMQIAPATYNDLWGSWGVFGHNTPWQPLVISKVGSNLDFSIYEYDNTSG